VIANSEAGRRDLVAAGVAPQAIDVVYNGVRLEDYLSPPAMDFRAAHRWPPSVVVVGFAGRFTAAKGVWEFVRAAEILVRRGAPCRFVMIGATEHHDSCQEEIAAYARERGFSNELAFAGSVCEMPGAYAGLDVMVVPSRSDTLPNVVLEAMASALPVVATSVGGIPEVVIEGQTGRLVPAGDVEALARAIGELAGDGAARRRLGAAGRRLAEKRFDVRASAGLVERTLLGRG
jgi:glycosyltransferase involved in cell wall biosynthesis